MTREEITNTFAKLLDQAVPGASLDDLESDDNMREALDIDSFDFLKLMEGVERELKVSVPESDYEKLGTLEETVDYLQSRMS